MAIYFQLEGLVDELSGQIVQSRKRLAELDRRGPMFHELQDRYLEEHYDLVSQRKGVLKAMEAVTELLGI